MIIPLEEYKHNNHIDIHSIKLASQRAPVSLLSSCVFIFSIYGHGIELLLIHTYIVFTHNKIHICTLASTYLVNMVDDSFPKEEALKLMLFGLLHFTEVRKI